MIIIGKFENKFAVSAVALFIVSLIGFFDYRTNQELSFSIFYLIPISIFSLYRGTKVIPIFLISIYASILWFYADINGREYSNVFFPIWNASVRLIIFSIIGLLLLYLKEKEKRLRFINNALEELNDEKNKIIGVAAHDLRNPIGGIYSFSDLLIENNKGKVNLEILDGLTLIKTLSNNTLSVLQNLLDVSVIESGKIELKLEATDYISFLRLQISYNQILASNKNITIHFQSQIESILVNFDSHYFSEVIDNLLSNSIKYSFNGSEIVVRVSMSEKNKILTEVIDNGKGISEVEQKNLFKYFQKTSTVPTEGEQSTGLGLAITKRIITLHSGEIGVSSVLNQGSNFYFTLPVRNI